LIESLKSALAGIVAAVTVEALSAAALFDIVCEPERHKGQAARLSLAWPETARQVRSSSKQQEGPC
jgi:hypothetical protein